MRLCHSPPMTGNEIENKSDGARTWICGRKMILYRIADNHAAYMRICMRIMYSIYPVSSPVTPMTMIGTITILGATKNNQHGRNTGGQC